MHVEDIVAAVEFEWLENVVPCGASYGGMPVTGRTGPRVVSIPAAHASFTSGGGYDG